MSIGLVLRHTYEETCEICDKIAVLMKNIGKKWNTFFTRVGYARAASQLASQGYYEEARALMTEKDKLK
tara:strand:+ start:833 stop:1039 length:207 start_codon:yes stop_codon:yes gene_type:complete